MLVAALVGTDTQAKKIVYLERKAKKIVFDLVRILKADIYSLCIDIYCYTHLSSNTYVLPFWIADANQVITRLA